MERGISRSTFINIVSILLCTILHYDLHCYNCTLLQVNYDASPGEIVYRFANISYDYNGKRIRVREFEDRNGERPERIDKLYLYNEQVGCLCIEL